MKARLRQIIGGVLVIGGVLAIMLGCPVAAAQTTPSDPKPAATVDPNESAVVQSLEVVGHYPGPPLWTVRQGDGEVVVLGGLSPLPHSLEWNSHRLERLMDGAKLVLLPPTGKVGLFDGLYMIAHLGDLRLGGGKTLWDTISPDERRRFEALMEAAHTQPRRYEHMKPLVAAAILNGDLVKAMGFSSAKPGTTVKRLAEAHGVRVRAEGGLSLIDAFRTITRMPDEAGARCLSDTLDRMERLRQNGSRAAEAWAVGDLRLTRAYRSDTLNACAAGSPGLQAIGEAMTREFTAAIRRALAGGDVRSPWSISGFCSAPTACSTG